jgi:hypothetical protein
MRTRRPLPDRVKGDDVPKTCVDQGAAFDLFIIGRRSSTGRLMVAGSERFLEAAFAFLRTAIHGTLEE